MRIKLTVDAIDGETVGFTSSAGAGVGRWRGVGIEAGTVLDIEFKFPSDLRWMVDIRRADDDQRTGFDSMGRAILCVENQHEDGLLAARLGRSAVLLATTGELPPLVGSLVSVRVSDLELHPTGI